VKRGWYAHVLGEAEHTFTDPVEAVETLRVSRAVLRCAVLCCAVLCCAVLCCAVLCCAVLCCAVRHGLLGQQARGLFPRSMLSFMYVSILIFLFMSMLIVMMIPDTCMVATSALATWHFPTHRARCLGHLKQPVSKRAPAASQADARCCSAAASTYGIRLVGSHAPLLTLTSRRETTRTRCRTSGWRLS